MQPLRNLSLRYKIPLRGTALVLVTAVVVTVSLIVKEREELKEDLVANAQSVGRVLAGTLVAPFVHEDLWRAFEIISATAPRASGELGIGADIVTVLDRNHLVYASTRPDRFPVLINPATVERDYVEVVDAARSAGSRRQTTVESRRGDMIYIVTPVATEGAQLGTLVIGYSKRTVFVPRFIALAKRAGLVTLLVLAVLLPGSWYWGSRFATPLVQLADSMGKLGASRLPPDADLKVYEAHDEIGQVGQAFRRMVRELRDKESLEREVVATERLAAVGRLAAGIAHEINNPLGGMLNAINTYKHHGKLDPLAAKTLSLLERGLLQIKDTVAALLVEAKVASHPLAPQDIEDTRTLVSPDAHQKAAQLELENQLTETLPLPSTLVRQILINLLLNAVQAVEPQGRVYCRVGRNGSHLHLLVQNDGQHIPAERMPYLFEPFSSQRESGHGLGLWVTYQIVTQLDGEITVASTPGDTRFAVQLPIPAWG